jgi:hypothetical protein
MNADTIHREIIALRRAGKSRRQIREILGPIGNSVINDALRGEPPPEWTKRPNAKDDLRARARQLRLQGLDYDDIVAALGVAKSSVSLWVRDLPRPERLSPEACRQRSAENTRKYWARERPVREARRVAEIDAIAAEVGDLTEREMLIAGAIAYWCEGTKTKRRRPNSSPRVTFVNSDPSLVRLFLRFVDVTGTSREDLTFRLEIHETADISTAMAFWLDVTGSCPQQFHRPSIKRARPNPGRRNVGSSYHGCLRIEVRRASTLYARIEGWASAIMGDLLPDTA